MNKVLQCKRCLLNSSHTEYFVLDENGVCNYCDYYTTVTASLGTAEEKARWLTEKVEQIKADGKNRSFDCILGVSGGVDSSYLAYWAKENGLRPLIVHFDNGWNSELAVSNIRNICEILGYSLETYVINWEEFKELQLAYLRAGVIDIEALTDHAIMATIYRLAEKHKIRYTINGFNYATEAIMPKGWVFDKTDFANIKDINARFGKTPIKSFPHLSFLKKIRYALFAKIESIKVLNYIPYDKAAAKTLLIEKLSWRDYGGKHYESIFTKFYQAYILPTKFGIDKRYAHLSNLICSGQITREKALEEIAKPLYNEHELRDEMTYVIKKLGLSEMEFADIMTGPVRKHEAFKTEKRLWQRYFKLVNFIKLKF